MIVHRENMKNDPQLNSDYEVVTLESKNCVGSRTAHPAKIELLTDLQKYFTELNNYSEIDAEEHLIYGMDISILSEKCKIKVGLIYTIDENSFIFLNPKSKKTNNLKIVLVKITDITKGKLSGNFKRYKSESKVKSLQENCCLTIHYDNNFKFYDLIFKSESHLNIFLKAIMIFLEKTINEINTFNTDLLTLKKIWKEYDPDHNKHLNMNQFSQFLSNINFKWKKKTNEQIFREIDTKNEGKIIFKDFISFYELIVTGEEFREVFQKYSSDPNKKYITVRGLMDFMEKEQHTKIRTNEVIALMTKYSKKARKLVEKMKIRNGNEIGELPTTYVLFGQFVNNSGKNLKDDQGQSVPLINPLNSNHNLESGFNSNQKILELGGHEIEQVESMLNIYENHSFGKNYYSNDINDDSIKRYNENVFCLNFREFVNMIIDESSNSVYNQIYFSNYQNMNLPLYDYYIYSSHNTYLDGNQINSNCNIEMYHCAIKNGCRLLELDCWDGRNGVADEPIITHWYFMVGELNFKEVLINIKRWAFKKSEFPVILSVENHCSPPAQVKMEMYFREILGMENLYIVDPENPPLNFPSPNDLKRKFVIKCKRKRIFGNFDKINLNMRRQLSLEGSGSKNNNESDKASINLKENNLMNLISANSGVTIINNNLNNFIVQNNEDYHPNDIKDNLSNKSKLKDKEKECNHNSSPHSQNKQENGNVNPQEAAIHPHKNPNSIEKIISIVKRIVPTGEVIQEEVNSISEENVDVNYHEIDNINLKNNQEENINNVEIDEISDNFDTEEGFDDEKLKRLCVGLEYKTKTNIDIKNKTSIIKIGKPEYKTETTSKNNIFKNIEIDKVENTEFLSIIAKNEPVMEETSQVRPKYNYASITNSPTKHKGSFLNLPNTGSLIRNSNPFSMANPIDMNNPNNLDGYSVNFNNFPNNSEFNRLSINEDNNLPKILFPKIEEGKELKLKNFNLNFFNETEDMKINLNQNTNTNVKINNIQQFSHSNNLPTQKNKQIKRKKSYTSYDSIENLEKNEIQSIFSNNSNLLFKKLKAKYSIDDQNEENQNGCSSSNNNQINDEFKTSIINKIQEIRDKDLKNLKKPVIKTIEVLQKLVGMVGVKYKREDFEKTNYLPWECISISEPDFIKYMQNIELKLRIIKLCQGSFLKIYPDILRTNSSNHDPIMCWSAGVQVAALNLQKTDDDWVLINKIFFKINGGRKSGYILKPEILRNPNCEETIRKLFWKPIYKIKFKILSGFHLHLCFPKGAKISGILVEVSLRSPYSEKNSLKEEVKLCTDTIRNNFLHPVWQSNSVQFEIYDPELSFIIVKLYSKKKKILLARSVIPVKILNLGYRVLDLYDKLCSKFESSFLIVKSNRILL